MKTTPLVVNTTMGGILHPASEMWGNNYLIKFYSTPPKESNKKLIHTALFSPAPRCYLVQTPLLRARHYTSILSFAASRLSVSTHLLCFFSPSSVLVQPPLFLLSHGGCRRRARATQVSGEKLGIQPIQDAAAAHILIDASFG